MVVMMTLPAFLAKTIVGCFGEEAFIAVLNLD